MAPTLLDLFRLLAAFEPVRQDLSKAPWEAYVDWAIGQGLAPLAAYNLEYRLGNCGAPEWARDRLLSIFQGSANDNVMKLVNFKRSVDDLEGRRIALLGAGSFAESLYPHVAWRPVIDLRLKFGLAEQAASDQTCIVVVQVEIGGRRVMLGVIVDRVSEVLNVVADEVERPPDFGERLDTGFMLGMAKVKGQVKILLDLDAILATDALYSKAA